MKRDPTTSDRRLASTAGAVSVGVTLGLSELAAGIFSRVPSTLSAVGSFVVDITPGVVESIAIEVFGTADKGALAIGTVVVAALIGAMVGRMALRRPGLPGAVFLVFGALGLTAALSQPLIAPLLTVIVVLVATLTGWAVVEWSLRWIQRPVEPTDGLAGDWDRRRFALSIAGVGAAALVTGAVGRRLIIGRSETVRKALDIAEPVTRVPALPAGSAFDVAGLTPVVVPSDDFYRIDTALVVPRPDPDSWRLKVTGLVDEELEFTLADLQAMPLHERFVTIACVSNPIGGDLVGNALWTGVRLVEILDRAGVHPDATQIVGRSVDGWTAGFPTAAAYDGRDPLIAIGMNRDVLPASHGFPARLIVPGLYGYVSATKWLKEIELTRLEDFDGFWIPRGWAKFGPIKTQSRIDTPRRGSRTQGAATVIAGVAFAPTKRIERVEVRVDGGPWLDAEISTPLSDEAWVQWKLEIELAPGDHRAEVRATDGTGETQTDIRTSPRPSGATGHHETDFEVV